MIGGLMTLCLGCGGPGQTPDSASQLATAVTTAQSGALDEIQTIVRAKCDKEAVVTAVRDQGAYDEAVWGEAPVHMPTGDLQTAPAFWAHLAKVQPNVQSTSCGQFEY